MCLEGAKDKNVGPHGACFEAVLIQTKEGKRDWLGAAYCPKRSKFTL